MEPDRPDVRTALKAFYDARLPLPQLLEAFVQHRDWLVVASGGSFRGIPLGEDVLVFAFTDREALELFLGKGGAKIRFGDGVSLAESIETWPYGFYVFHQLPAPIAAVQVNPQSGVPAGFSLEREHFPLAERIAREALVVDVLRAGAADPRFRTVLLRHAPYHVLAPGDPLLSLPGDHGQRGALVFTSRAAADRFLAQHPPPPDTAVAIATIDGASLFSQLREHGYAVIFDRGSPHEVAFDARLPGFVLSATSLARGPRRARFRRSQFALFHEHSTR